MMHRFSWLFPVDHYAALGLSRSASSQEVESAYAALLQLPEPTGLRRWLCLLMGHTSQACEHAYRVLSDPHARASYDEQLDMVSLLTGHPPC